MVLTSQITEIYSCGDACVKCNPLCATCQAASPAVC